MAWAYFRAFLVMGLLYMPMLGLACEFAGVPLVGAEPGSPVGRIGPRTRAV